MSFDTKWRNNTFLWLYQHITSSLNTNYIKVADEKRYIGVLMTYKILHIKIPKEHSLHLKIKLHSMCKKSFNKWKHYDNDTE